MSEVNVSAALPVPEADSVGHRHICLRMLFPDLCRTFLEKRARNRAVEFYGAIDTGGFSSGLIICGLLVGIGGLWIFLFLIPLTPAVLIVSMLVIPKKRPASTSRYDPLGNVALVIALLLLFYAAVTDLAASWFSTRTLVLLSVAIVLFTTFVLLEKRVLDPPVRLSIFRSGGLVHANLSFFALLGSYFSFQFLLILSLQGPLKWIPLQLALSPVNVQTVADTDDQEQGVAVGLLNSSTQMSGMVVPAIITAFISPGRTPNTPDLHCVTEEKYGFFRSGLDLLCDSRHRRIRCHSETDPPALREGRESYVRTDCRSTRIRMSRQGMFIAHWRQTSHGWRTAHGSGRDHRHATAAPGH